MTDDGSGDGTLDLDTIGKTAVLSLLRRPVWPLLTAMRQ